MTEESDEYKAREVADAIGGRIDRADLKDGTIVISIETDDQSVVGDGLTEGEAWTSLLAAAAEVGWYDEEE